MTTSEHQRKMHRITADNPVRRRLFPVDTANIDNFVNDFKESAIRENNEKMKKWNFDFENEVPLEGTYIWYRANEPTDWIGIKSDENNSIEVLNKEDKLITLKTENEATPKVIDKKSELNKPIIRKRKRNLLRHLADPVARRRIDF